MQPQSALRDCQTQSDAPGLAITSVIHSIKGTKDFGQRILRHASPVVANGNHNLACFIKALEFDFNLRAFTCVLNRITYNVFDRATQQLFIANDRAAFRRLEFY